MTLNLSNPILYLITRGATDKATTEGSTEFQNILLQVSSAVAAGIPLIQIREKELTTRALFELSQRAVKVARGTTTRILVNDRADVALAAGAAGVHLTTKSIDAELIRQKFGRGFVIGVSTHSSAEIITAREAGADFVVYGPVFSTASKKRYGPPVGLEELSRAASDVQPFPVLALGGITVANAASCLDASASGVAGISLFSKPERLQEIATTIREFAKGTTK